MKKSCETCRNRGLCSGVQFKLCVGCKARTRTAPFECTHEKYWREECPRKN